jgi:hypothetical protein
MHIDFWIKTSSIPATNAPFIPAYQKWAGKCLPFLILLLFKSGISGRNNTPRPSIGFSPPSVHNRGRASRRPRCPSDGHNRRAARIKGISSGNPYLWRLSTNDQINLLRTVLLP